MKLYVLFGMLFMTFQTHSQNAVKITFMPKFESENLTLNKVYYFKNDTLNISNFKCYISNLTYYKNDSIVHSSIKKAHLIDATDSSSFIILENEFFKFDKIRFNIGVDSLTNVSGIFEGDLDPANGMYWMLYYGADIFEKALGFGKEDILAQQILLAFVNLIFTFVAMFSVDNFGRKPLLYIGSIGMIIGFLLLGISLQQQAVGYVSLLGVLIFIASFALSMGPVVWVLLSEMFPNKIRSVAMSVAVAAQWAANYVVSQSFPIVMDSEVNNGTTWNGSLPYFIFIAFIVIIMVITYKYIPETKGKSLEEIERFWEV